MKKIDLTALHAHDIDEVGRRLFFSGPIDGAATDSATATDRLVRNLLVLDRTDGPIEIWINSGGGETHAALGVYDAIRACRNHVTTVVCGEACSAGGLILVSGDSRYSTRHSYLMFHGVSSDVDPSGQTKRVEQTARVMRRVHDRYVTAFAARTKKPKTYWAGVADSGHDLWLDARQMKQHGIIDGIWPEDAT